MVGYIIAISIGFTCYFIAMNKLYNEIRDIDDDED